MTPLKILAWFALSVALLWGACDLWLERKNSRAPRFVQDLPAHLIDGLELAERLWSPLISPSGRVQSESEPASAVLDFETAEQVLEQRTDELFVHRREQDDLGQGGVLEVEAKRGGSSRLSFTMEVASSGFLELQGKIRIYTRLAPNEILQTLRTTRRLPQAAVSLEPSTEPALGPPQVRCERAEGDPPSRAVALLPQKQAVDIFSFASWQPFSVPVLAPEGTRIVRVTIDVFVPAFILGFDDLKLCSIDPLSTIDPVGRFRFAAGTETTARLRKVIRAGEEDRLSLLFVPGTIVTERVLLEPRSRLDIGATFWTMQGLSPVGERRSVQCRVESIIGRVVEQTFTFEATGDEPVWQQASMDLLKLGGGEALVTLKAPESDSWRDPPYLLLSDPCVSCERPAGSKLSGVLLITLDALSADHLASRGYSRPTSPTLDRISEEGVSFLNAISPSPSTYTSLPALMASQHRRDGWKEFAARLSAETETLPMAFTRGGFLVRPFIADFYFNSFFKGFYDRPFAYGGLTNQTEKIDEWLVRELTEWIRSVKDRQFFAWIHTNQPHGPNRPYPDHDLFRAEPQVALAQQAIEDFRAREGVEGARTLEEAADQISLRRRQYPAELVKQAEVVLTALYDAAIHQADALVQMIDETLREEGLEDRVLVAISSDHGWPLAPVIRNDLLMPEASFLVPLILRGPQIPAGVKVPQRVSTIDVSATLLLAAGIEPPASFEGVDLRPYFKDPRHATDRFVAAQSKDLVLGYQGPWRLLVRRDVFLERKLELPREGVFLFDLDNDPEGARDVIGERAALALDLWKHLDDWHFTAPGAFEDVTLSKLLIGHFRRAGYLQDRDQ